MATSVSTGSTATPQSPGAGNLGDIQQLQKWAQHVDVTIQEINTTLNRLNNVLSKVITLNSLKHP